MRKYLLKPDKPDARDHILEVSTTQVALPSQVDLRTSGYLSPIVDQGQLGSCTANAIACGLMEFLLRKSEQDTTHLSRLFLYWYERSLEGTVSQDSGATLRDGMKALQKWGCSPEGDFPYDISKFTDTPSQQADTDALKFKIPAYKRVPSIHAIKVSLANGFPVVIGTVLYESFESEEVAATGIVPMPDPSEQELGGHALCVVGYDDDEQNLVIRNSWGEQWGDSGYCYIPYAYAKQYFSDMWTSHL